MTTPDTSPDGLPDIVDARAQENADARAARAARGRWTRSRAGRWTIAAVCLTAAVFGLLVAGFFVSAYQVHAGDQQWCTTLDLLAGHPYVQPSDPAAKPAEAEDYQLYTDFKILKVKFSC
jgi:hypothetical protein